MSGQTKARLRNNALKRRKTLSDAEILKRNQKILHFFSNWTFSNIHYVHSFYPIPRQKEPDTLLLVQWLRSHHPDIKIVLPKSDLKNLSMQHYLWDEQVVLGFNKWNIVEPLSGHEVTPKLLDLILVPLLEIDIRGNRVGYGKGFYDRFLAQCRSDVQKVGLSLFDPVAPIEDVSPFDIPLDACITPSGIIWF
ncbi:5-formyltetrahydrofolate cyclo-ligase [bacterium A37T11]|nr:5-formyltetrahydrofolate cyclo-ligase [bacterium A37T11]